MSDIDVLFGSIKENVNDLLKDPRKLTYLERTNIYKLLENALEMNQKFSSVFSILSTADLFALKEKFQQKLSSKVNPMTSKTLLKIINMYFDGLGSTGKMLDRKLGPFTSLNKVSSELVTILFKLKQRFNDYLPNEYVTINDIRLSTLAVIQFILFSDLVCTTSEYILSIVLDVVSEYPIPKYRYAFLDKHQKKVMRFLNDILEHKGIFDIVKNIDKMKADGADSIISNGNTAYNFAFITKIASAIKSFFIHEKDSPVKGINMFRRVGEVYDSWLHDKYLKNKKQKEWLQEKVALAKANLEGMDKDSPAYQKILKIVEVYDEEIIDLDQSINNYLEEE